MLMRVLHARLWSAKLGTNLMYLFVGSFLVGEQALRLNSKKQSHSEREVPLA